MVEQIKRYWLRRRGTDFVCQRTRVLAKNDDMIPISEEDAMKIRAIKDNKALDCRIARNAGMAIPTKESIDDAKHRELVEQGLIPADEAELDHPQMHDPNREKTLLEMNEVELRKKAFEMKILIGDEATAEDIREEINRATVVLTGPPPEDESHTDFAPEGNDDLNLMNHKQLFDEAGKVGVVKKGDNATLRIQIRQARKAQLETAGV